MRTSSLRKHLASWILILPLIPLLACTASVAKKAGGEGGAGGSEEPTQPEWDPKPPAATCRAGDAAPALDAVLAQTGLNRSTFVYNADFDDLDFLADPFRLSWMQDARDYPAKAGCQEGKLVGPLDHYLAQPHPVAGMIRHLATTIDQPVANDPPLPRLGWESALEALCATAGGCDEAEGELPAELRRALGPVLFAISKGLETRYELDGAVVQRTPSFWRDHGGGLLLGSTGADAINFSGGEDRSYLVGENRSELYLAAIQIAFAIEDVDWAPFRGMMGVSFDLRTEAGWIMVRDGADHRYEADDREVLLQLDLGGDDVYLGEVASNRSGANAVSIAIDLQGDDHYGYDPVATAQDRDELLPADADGRSRTGTPTSLSKVSRQGGARNGIAMLFDLGEGDDHYQSLRASQGYAHLGVGVLFDAGGDDVYLAEALSQGAAQFGIGLLVDAGAGNDSRRAFTYSQGFGFSGGVGALVDGGGDDVYLCDNGDPAHGGFTLYPTPQLPDQGNTSLCQGAGYGARMSPEEFSLSGGLGILRDLGGDDRYEASVFAQGAGYWQGVGLLSDGGGSDTYDALWYVQGAAAHFALGILVDAGAGDDVFGGKLVPVNMSLGAGHDLSTGVLIKEQGNDEYHLGNLSAGASNCNGLGLFVDNGGNDRYVGVSDRSAGVADLSAECSDRPYLVSIGIMIDAGGTDSYDFPTSAFPIPKEGGKWGHARNGLSSEHGAGLDTTGETGVHAESEAFKR